MDKRLKKGDVVTFSFDKLSRLSTPINPKIIRSRSDVSWREIIIEHAEGKDERRVREKEGERGGEEKRMNEDEDEDPSGSTVVAPNLNSKNYYYYNY